MSKTLVIVESPTKAKTISRFLGDDYVVESSVGHIRDLPANASEVPAAYKGESWASMGVNVDDGFTPIYVVNKDKKDHVRALKRLVKDAEEVILATDEDREGEAIAWHLLEELRPKVPVKRIVFHEITKTAIAHAMANPGELDRGMVEAQEARRILDRLVGYEVSPVLWKKVNPGLSAGRVQSVATRIIVERERERMRFVSAQYHDLDANAASSDGETFGTKMVGLDGARLASGRDFGEDGQLAAKGKQEVVVLGAERAASLATALAGATATVVSVEAKPYRRRPYAPFTTSTLQQEAGRKLRFSSARTMQIAQRLYENGHITYMRTDSTNLSETAINAARGLVKEKYGDAYLPDSPRRYTKKSKNAQEAHEAVRPAGESFASPESLRRSVSGEEFRLYELIWQRTVASQMSDAVGESVSVRMQAAAGDATTEWAASGRTITFPGFLRAYVEGSDDPDEDLADREKYLPTLAEGDTLTLRDVEAKAHETSPPSRFTEASLVKRLEELGVGRPSTYSSIIQTIVNRRYVSKRGQALIPSFTAFAVVTLLESHFGELVDYAFTARMEDDLDEIASGERASEPWLRRLYFGGEPDADGDAGLDLKRKVTERLDQIDARAVNSIPLGVDADGQPIVARVGRYGPYLERGEDRASVPEDLAPDELTIEKAVELLDAPSGVRHLGVDEASGLPILARNGRFGPYVSIGAEDEKPEKTASLFKDMDLATVDLETAVLLLSLPRVVGVHPDDQGEILAMNGRYGPYLKWGKETRSLEEEAQIFLVTLEEALTILAQPKYGGRKQTPPLKELGEDPISGKPMVVKKGRYGPYVTDGETNASLPKDLEPAELTDERAAELLQIRREKGPAKKRAKKATKKKATKKKTTAKKKTTKKKTTAKKNATKKKATAKKKA